MNKVPQPLIDCVRARGFRGSGQNFRKAEADCLLVVNFQGSQSGPRFYINLGAQPLFIPTESNRSADPKKLKEYECVFRQRVRGGSHAWNPTSHEASALSAVFADDMDKFFGQALGFKNQVLAGNVRPLAEELPWGVPPARACLHIARACRELGLSHEAESVAELGLTLAGEPATALRGALRQIAGGAA
jgi:hypothetical protein